MMSLKRKMATTSAPVQIIDMNVLPRDRRPVEFAPIAAVALVVLLACVGAMIPLALKLHDARASAAAIEAQANDAQRGVQALQLKLARQRGLSGELEAAKTKLAALDAQRAGLQGGNRPLQQDLTMLFGYGAFLPAGVRVTAVTGTDGTFTVDGVAPGPLDAIAYASTLVESGGFPAARMASFAPAAKSGGQFSIEVTR
jgi:hypothetical protein